MLSVSTPSKVLRPDLINCLCIILQIVREYFMWSISQQISSAYALYEHDADGGARAGMSSVSCIHYAKPFSAYRETSSHLFTNYIFVSNP